MDPWGSALFLDETSWMIKVWYNSIGIVPSTEGSNLRLAKKKKTTPWGFFREPTVYYDHNTFSAIAEKKNKQASPVLKKFLSI